MYFIQPQYEDTIQSKAWFQEIQEKNKKVVIPKIGEFLEDLQHIKWFSLSEYETSSTGYGVSYVCLRYSVKRPLKLLMGRACQITDKLDGYIRKYMYTYVLCLFRPFECLDPQYSIIMEPKIFSDNETITREIKLIEEMISNSDA